MPHTGQLIQTGPRNFSTEESIRKNISSQEGVASRFTDLIAAKQRILDDPTSTTTQIANANQAITAFTKQRQVVLDTISQFKGEIAEAPRIEDTPEARQAAIQDPSPELRAELLAEEGSATRATAQRAVQTATQFGAEPGVSGSIVDFLKSKGLESGFASRAQLFAQLGGTGEFIGSAEQNLGLLGTLTRAESDAGLTLTSQNFQNVITGFGQTPTPGTTPSTTVAGGVPSIPTGGAIPSGLTSLAQTAAGGAFPGADDILTQAREGFEATPGFQLQSQAAEAARGKIEVGTARDIKSFIQDQAVAGLTFSGGRKSGVREIEADKLAQLSGIDRDLALVLVQGIEKGVQDLVKEAQKGQERAITSLGQLGFVVNPETGELIQKPSEARAQAKFAQDLAEGPDILSVAEAARFGVPFGTTEDQVKGIVPPKTTEEFTRGDRTAIAFAEITSRAAPALIESTGTDGFVDPGVFAKFFKEITQTAPTKIDNYKLQFGPLLNPSDAAQFGISPTDLDPFDALIRRAGGT